MKMADLSLQLHEMHEKGRIGGAVFATPETDTSCDKYGVSESLPPPLKLISAGACPFLDNVSQEIPGQHPPVDIDGGESNHRCVGEIVRIDRLSKIPVDCEKAVPTASTLCENENSINIPHGIVCQDDSQIDCILDSSALSNPVNGKHRIFPADTSSTVEVKIELQRKVLFGTLKAKSMNDGIPRQNSLVLTPKQKSKPRKFCYSHSIPINVNHSGSLGTPRYYSGPLFGRSTSRDKDDFSIFKTKSLKLERQISRLQSRRQLDCPNQKKRACANKKAEQKGMPAGRYFAALTGPELEILKVVRLKFFCGFRL